MRGGAGRKEVQPRYPGWIRIRGDDPFPDRRNRPPENVAILAIPARDGRVRHRDVQQAAPCRWRQPTPTGDQSRAVSQSAAMHSRSARRAHAGEGTGIDPRQTRLYCDSYLLLGAEAALLRASGQFCVDLANRASAGKRYRGTNSSVAEASSSLCMPLYRPSQVNLLVLPARVPGRASLPANTTPFLSKRNFRLSLTCTHAKHTMHSGFAVSSETPSSDSERSFFQGLVPHRELTG
jgi:hypothetical protein